MRRRLVPLLVAVAAVVTACGGGEEAQCGSVVREPLDARSGVHLVPGAEVPDFETDPPTSGAHFATEPPSGVLEQALSEPEQVTVLEAGGVLLQHDGLDTGDREALEALGDDLVVVAPNPDLPSPLVATAWITKMECSGWEPEAVSDFATTRTGDAPGAG